jgi:hypothetical protein
MRTSAQELTRLGAICNMKILPSFLIQWKKVPRRKFSASFWQKYTLFTITGIGVPRDAFQI